jgi:glucose/mannose transport system substrate-binding protein
MRLSGRVASAGLLIATIVATTACGGDNDGGGGSSTKDPDGTKCWLKTVGSAEGQQSLNTKKGSIPARTDADASDYPAYQQAAIADWKTLEQVPSCAHGAGCSQGWQGALNSAMGKFSGDQDTAALQAALVAAAGQFAKK